MTTHPWFEHEARAYPPGWQPADNHALTHLNDDLGVEVLRPVWHKGQPMLKAAEYVGLVRVGRHSLQVLPKLYRNEGSNQQRTQAASRGLLAMFDYAHDLRLREHEQAQLTAEAADWFEVLTRLFASHLLDEWQRGAFRTYQQVEDDLPVLRGRWRINEQLRHPQRRHIFSVGYDEFTTDNPLNRIFRYVVERLLRRSRNSGNLRLLGELRDWLAEVSLPVSVSVAEAAPSLISRLNQRYLPLLNLARLFLANNVLDQSAGGVDSFAFVFDMNLLFEQFIAGFLRRHQQAILGDSGLEVIAQAGSMALATDEASRHVFHLRPDIALRRGKHYPLLLDTKYKQLDISRRDLGVSQSDFYQMYAYARRYNCPHVVLLYPQTAGSNSQSRSFSLHDGGSIMAATVDLTGDLWRAEGREELVNDLHSILTEHY